MREGIKNVCMSYSSIPTLVIRVAVIVVPVVVAGRPLLLSRAGGPRLPPGETRRPREAGGVRAPPLAEAVGAAPRAIDAVVAATAIPPRGDAAVASRLVAGPLATGLAEVGESVPTRGAVAGLRAAIGAAVTPLVTERVTAGGATSLGAAPPASGAARDGVDVPP